LLGGCVYSADGIGWIGGIPFVAAFRAAWACRGGDRGAVAWVCARGVVVRCAGAAARTGILLASHPGRLAVLVLGEAVLAARAGSHFRGVGGDGGGVARVVAAEAVLVLPEVRVELVGGGSACAAGMLRKNMKNECFYKTY